MAFEGLSEKLSAAFKKLRGKGRLSEADVKEAMKEIKMALLEADVNFKVVKSFVASAFAMSTGSIRPIWNTGMPSCSPTTSNCLMAAGRYTSQAHSRGRLPCFFIRPASFAPLVVLPAPWRETVKPTEILLVVDAMIGQDAVTAAKAFDEALDIDGVMLTKLDGDARGGAALSIRAVTGKPIKFAGTGEKLDAVERWGSPAHRGSWTG